LSIENWSLVIESTGMGRFSTAATLKTAALQFMERQDANQRALNQLNRSGRQDADLYGRRDANRHRLIPLCF
jgi:hypothetical protein